MAGELDTQEEPEKEIEVLLPNTTIVTHCIMKNDVPRLVKCFEDEQDPYKEDVSTLVNERDADGKSPLDLSVILNRLEMTRELLQRGADVHSTTGKGYCALHQAAAWGRIGALKILMEYQSNLQQKTTHGERPRETAVRYNQTECIDFLDWAEAKVSLLDTIKLIQETIADPEKVQGRLSKEDKGLALNTCKEKAEWVESASDATTQDFLLHKQALDDVMTPIYQKLNEPPPEKPEKK
ncbi:hypothetical protein ScPMuIL_010930 [Solemya velum]